MAGTTPHTELHPDFSAPDAAPTPWSAALAVLEQAEIFWISTVRPDGRPHVTPLLAVWHDGALYFCTGSDERKAKNLAANPHCILTTGRNSLNDGLDIVVEGEARRITDDTTLQRLAARYAAKYDWQYTVRDGAFVGDEGNVAQVYEVRPAVAFGFGKGAFSQTRWRFPAG